MTKLVAVVLLIFVNISLFYSVLGFDNATVPEDLVDEGRLIISGIIRSKCTSRLNAKSTVLPNVGVTLTRLANGRLYFFSPPVPAANRVNYDSARTFCRDHGMHLVTINSAEENLLVYTKATELGLAQANPVLGPWIGYRDVSGTGTYQWVYPPKAGTTPTFFTAASTPPAVGNCAAYTDAVNLVAVTSWTTYPCNQATHPFICEMEPPCSLVL